MEQVSLEIVSNKEDLLDAIFGHLEGSNLRYNVRPKDIQSNITSGFYTYIKILEIQAKRGDTYVLSFQQTNVCILHA